MPCPRMAVTNTATNETSSPGCPVDWFRGNLPWLLVLAISLSIITSYFHHHLYVSAPNLELLSIDHLKVVQGYAEAPMQYRPAPYFMAQTLLNVTVRFGLPNNSYTLVLCYFILQFVATTLCYLALLKFLSKWFDLKRSILGLCFLVAVNPLAEFQYYHQPGDPWNFLFFLLGYIAIARRRDAWLWPIIFIGVPFRETVLLLIPAHFAARVGEAPVRKIILWTLALCAAWLIPTIALRLVFGFQENYMVGKLIRSGLPSVLYFNLTRPEGWLVLFLYFNVLWLALPLTWRRLPKTIRRMFVIVPIFLIVHLFWGRLIEGRLYMPLMPLFLPAGLAYLGNAFPERR